MLGTSLALGTTGPNNAGVLLAHGEGRCVLRKVQGTLGICSRRVWQICISALKCLLGLALMPSGCLGIREKSEWTP